MVPPSNPSPASVYFTPKHINQDQTEENVISLRFLGELKELETALDAMTTRTREVSLSFFEVERTGLHDFVA